MKSIAEKIYKGTEAAELPAYEIVEAARYLRVPYFTLYDWLRPIEFNSINGKLKKPIIQRPRNSKKLSFLNLIEAHVVKALRKEHNVPCPEIRAALDYAEHELGISRLLVNKELKAGAKQLFVKKFGQLINLGRGGQLAIEKMLSLYLERIDYDHNLPEKLYPFVAGSERKIISISPFIGFGKPIIASAGISTYVLAERFELGEDKRDIAKDYNITETEVEEAIIYEAVA